MTWNYNYAVFSVGSLMGKWDSASCVLILIAKWSQVKKDCSILKYVLVNFVAGIGKLLLAHFIDWICEFCEWYTYCILYLWQLLADLYWRTLALSWKTCYSEFIKCLGNYYFARGNTVNLVLTCFAFICDLRGVKVGSMLGSFFSL